MGPKSFEEWAGEGAVYVAKYVGAYTMSEHRVCACGKVHACLLFTLKCILDDLITSGQMC